MGWTSAGDHRAAPSPGHGAAHCCLGRGLAVADSARAWRVRGRRGDHLRGNPPDVHREPMVGVDGDGQPYRCYCPGICAGQPGQGC